MPRPNNEKWIDEWIQQLKDKNEPLKKDEEIDFSKTITVKIPFCGDLGHPVGEYCDEWNKIYKEYFIKNPNANYNDPNVKKKIDTLHQKRMIEIRVARGEYIVVKPNEYSK